ncbi:alpha/beta-hydrolase [Neoconidiobolus thromboides FSU 785]|nr:alpha/beta-hydrolase [Neoconidiobolus thromboides FSU 785]
MSDKSYSYNDLNQNNRFDLITPLNYTSNSPLLLWIPSGGWVSEDIEPSRLMAADLAKNYGIVTAIVHYCLSQKGGSNHIKHPSHIKDILNAFFNITSSLNRFNLKDSKIIVGGHSAGAHLSALLALDPNQYINNSNNKLLNQIKGVISIGGIFDLELLAKQDSSYIHQFIEPAFGINESGSWNQASPQYSITSDSLNKIHYTRLPKYLLIDSIEDTLVDSQQTTQFAKHLNDVGLKKVNVIQGKFGQHDQIPTYNIVQNSIAKFILEQIK